jgi:hypothetical protein
MLVIAQGVELPTPAKLQPRVDKRLRYDRHHGLPSSTPPPEGWESLARLHHRLSAPWRSPVTGYEALAEFWLPMSHQFHQLRLRRGHHLCSAVSQAGCASTFRIPSSLRGIGSGISVTMDRDINGGERHTVAHDPLVFSQRRVDDDAPTPRAEGPGNGDADLGGVGYRNSILHYAAS